MHCGGYSYYTGNSAPGDVTVGPGELRDIQVIVGPGGAVLQILSGCPIIIPSNFSFCTNKFCSGCCPGSFVLTGDVIFYFISFCKF